MYFCSGTVVLLSQPGSVSQVKAQGSHSGQVGALVPYPHRPMSLPPPPPDGARDLVTPQGSMGPVTPAPWASGAPSPEQPLLRQEAKGEEEEGEETGVQGAGATGTGEQRRRGWGEAAETAAVEEGQVEARDAAAAAAAAGTGAPAGGAGGGRGAWRRLLAWLRRRQPQCCPCAAPLPRSAAHCCHGGTKMAALAYNLGKREINHYFSVRSAKLLALVAVLLLAACHLASRRYRGERTLPLPQPAARRRRRGAWRPPPRPTPAHAHAAARAPGPLGRRGPHVPPDVPGGGPGATGRLSRPQGGPPLAEGLWSEAPEPPARGSARQPGPGPRGSCTSRSGETRRPGARGLEVGRAALGDQPSAREGQGRSAGAHQLHE